MLKDISVNSSNNHDSIASPSKLEAGLQKPEHAYTRLPKEGKDDLSPGHRGGVIWVKNEIRIREDDAEWPLRSP